MRTESVSLLCDFWKDGSAFDNGWELLCPTGFEYSDFDSITHIWFSHEHPDHFSPANLRSIPEEYRKRITILFQETEDKRVINYCKKLNFCRTIELKPYVAHRLSSDVEIVCAPYGASYADVDSWLCVKAGGKTLLNFNDCEFVLDDRIERIRQACGSIDVLATQYSFASKQGDSDDQSWIAPAQEYHLRQLEQKVRRFEPTWTVPFASFSYWSHQENQYLNAGIVKVETAAQRISQSGSVPIVMSVQDSWEVGSTWNNEPALTYYAERYDWLHERPLSSYVSSPVIDESELISTAQAFVKKMTKHLTVRQLSCHVALQHADIRHDSGTAKLPKHVDAIYSCFAGRYKKCRIHVYDLDRCFEFTFQEGLTRVDTIRENCDISIGSQALHYSFSVPFGGEALQVNGRFQNIDRLGWKFLRCFFFLARRLDQKQKIPRSALLSAVSQKMLGAR